MQIKGHIPEKAMNQGRNKKGDKKITWDKNRSIT